MAITGDITKQSIVDRFEDLVTDVANAGIVRGTNSKPFTEMPDSRYAGTTTGDSINITGASISGDKIDASRIRNVLETEAALYTNIRNQRAILNVTGPGGNTGSRPTAGVVSDETNVAYLDAGDRASLGSISQTGISTGDTIDDATLETYLGRIASAYNSIRTSTITDQIDVCHASCHSSCHGSRGRR